MKNYFLFFLLILLASGCKKASILGRWQIRSITVAGNTVNGFEEYLSFKSDSIGYYESKIRYHSEDKKLLDSFLITDKFKYGISSDTTMTRIFQVEEKEIIENWKFKLSDHSIYMECIDCTVDTKIELQK